MTKKQIDVSWTQAKTTAVHSKFGTEMAKRTVINRAAKNYINTSNDSDTLVQAINETTENEYDEEVRRKDVTETASTEEKSKSLAEKYKERQAKLAEQAESKKEEPVKEEPVEEVKEEPTPDPEPEEEQEEVPETVEDDNTVDVEYEEVEEEEKPVINLNNYSVEQLQRALDNYGVPYDKKARKPELVEIADRFLNGGEDVAEQTSLI